MKEKKMTFRKLLKEIDFDYEVENDEIRLIDEQDAYLGSIAEDRWPAEQASVPAIIDRMEIYWNDYVYGGIVNPSLNSDGKELDGYEDNGNYEELLRYCEAHGIKNYLTEILYYIVHPNEVIFEEGCK